MTEAQKYLKQAKVIEAIVDGKQEDLDWLYGKVTKSTSTWGGEVVSGTRSQDKIGDIVPKIVGLRNEINAAIDELVDKRQEIINVIEKLQDHEQIKVLRYLYVGVWDQDNGTTKYLKLEEIAEKIHTSKRTAERIHGRALQAVEELMKEGAN